MFAIPAIAGTPTALTLSPTVLAATSPVTAVTTRQTPIAPSAPLSDQPVADNNNGASAQFIAQAIAQQQENEDSTVALATVFEQVAPAPEYNVFVSYGYIKYKPSDAGLPQLSLPFPSTPDTTAATPAPVPNDYQAYSNTQSRNVTNLYPDTVQLAVAG